MRHNLEQRIDTMGMKDKIFDVVVPTEEEIEVKEGKRRTVERRVFPGYILVNMILSEESWYVVRNTPGVTGFVGMGTQPTPLRPEEVAQIVKRMEAEAPRIKVTFKQGERVRIVDGPFNDFRGTVVGDRYGTRQGARDGQLLRPRNTGRVGLFASREGITQGRSGSYLAVWEGVPFNRPL